MIFIGGMMVMVEGMGAAGFFRWICLLVARLVKYRVIPILITFMLLSGFLSMFIDSITVMLFLATVTIELARLLKFDPVPVIIAEIFASNTGGSATMSGDPPNIIIGTHFHYTFMDFPAQHRAHRLGRHDRGGGPLLPHVPQGPEAVGRRQPGRMHRSTTLNPREAITNPRLFCASTAIFVLIVVLLVTHAQTGLSVGLIGVHSRSAHICWRPSRVRRPAAPHHRGCWTGAPCSSSSACSSV